MKALSIRQPWAWLIVQGHKDIENRYWPINYRGSMYIHAPQTVDPISHVYLVDRVPEDTLLELDEILNSEEGFQTGGIIGRVELVDCVTESASLWFQGPFGWVLKNPETMPFLPCKGQLGLWNFIHRKYE